MTADTPAAATKRKVMGGYDDFAVCQCGWYRRAPFGDMRHVHTTVCPVCGEGRWTWKVVTGRPVRIGGFWNGRVVIEPKSKS